MFISNCFAYSDISAELRQQQECFTIALKDPGRADLHLTLSYPQAKMLADRYILNQSERGSILRHFIMGADNSKYGLIQAVTRASQDIEDYDRATTLERLGGELLAIPANKMIAAPKETPVMRNVTPMVKRLEMA